VPDGTVITRGLFLSQQDISPTNRSDTPRLMASQLPEGSSYRNNMLQ